MFFVIFDMEAVFIFIWSVTLKENGWAGFIEMAVFIGILFCALIYLWRLGGLETKTIRQQAHGSGNTND
jgi:NADH-quinone oxidoreductase subunit A